MSEEMARFMFIVKECEFDVIKKIHYPKPLKAGD